MASVDSEAAASTGRIRYRLWFHFKMQMLQLLDWRRGICDLETVSMEAPQVDGLQAGKLIGTGGCGRVYQAKDDEGAAVAVKVFDGTAISRGLLEKMTKRLEAGGWPAGVMPVDSAAFKEGRSFWVMPLLAGVKDGGDPVPRSLQMSIDAHPGDGSWRLVRSLARA